MSGVCLQTRVQCRSLTPLEGYEALGQKRTTRRASFALVFGLPRPSASHTACSFHSRSTSGAGLTLGPVCSHPAKWFKWFKWFHAARRWCELGQAELHRTRLPRGSAVQLSLTMPCVLQPITCVRTEWMGHVSPGSTLVPARETCFSCFLRWWRPAWTSREIDVLFQSCRGVGSSASRIPLARACGGV